MKPKLVAIVVILVLAVSMIFSVVAAVDQAVNDDSTGVGSSLEADQDSDDNSLVHSLKLICPFH